MVIKRTTIKGLAFDLLIEEVNERTSAGGLICYMASVYRVEKGTGAKQLIRRSRLPGAADEMRRQYERDGLQALRRLAA
ncbi:hypothetical protein AB3G45_22410 [Shinella sp. S4-D37]|uniref:hypothetical protein n=1 Tax=Shinella sp. S4-D37 TaxID=3161999 RepID=UPI00346709F3